MEFESRPYRARAVTIAEEISEAIDNDHPLNFTEGLKVADIIEEHLERLFARSEDPKPRMVRNTDPKVDPPIEQPALELKGEIGDAINVSVSRKPFENADDQKRSKLSARIRNRRTITRDEFLTFAVGAGYTIEAARAMFDKLTEAGRFIPSRGSAHKVVSVKAAAQRIMQKVPVDVLRSKFARKNGAYRYAKELGIALHVHEHSVLDVVRKMEKRTR